MYTAILTSLSNVRPCPGADRLLLADAAGYQVLVGKGHAEGEPGIVFPEGGQIDHDFALANKLYRKHPETGEAMGGMLEPNRRIRALVLRGQESMGLWLPLSSLDCFGVDEYVEGKQITEWAGREVVRRYETPLQHERRASAGGAVAKHKGEQPLPQHYDTPQWRSFQIPPDWTHAYVTEKLHGTSARTGRVLVHVERRTRFGRWLESKGLLRRREEYRVISGTRRCLLTEGAQGEKGAGYRQAFHDLLAPHVLDGEVWYYEIVGFDERGVSIMAAHHIDDQAIGDKRVAKALREANGGESRVVYHYGCKPDGIMPNSAEDVFYMRDEVPALRCCAYVYRITQGDRELTHDEIEERVDQVGKLALRFIPCIDLFTHENTTAEVLRSQVNVLTRGSGHAGVPLREGVCVRFERHDGVEREVVSPALKHKGFLFCALEGIARNDQDFVDAEELA